MQQNTHGTAGTLTNKCDHTATCRFCPAKGGQVDKTQCRSLTIPAGEMRTGAPSGLVFDSGFDGMGYDCTEEHDPPACLAL